MMKFLKWVFFGFLGLFVLGMIIGTQEQSTTSAPESSTAQPEDAKPPAPQAAAAQSSAPAVVAIVVSARELSQAYEDNEPAADVKYKGKLLQVTGTVSAITKDMFDSSIIEMSGLDEFRSVRAELAAAHASDALALKKGNKIAVQCVGNGKIITSVILAKCQVI